MSDSVQAGITLLEQSLMSILSRVNTLHRSSSEIEAQLAGLHEDLIGVLTYLGKLSKISETSEKESLKLQ